MKFFFLMALLCASLNNFAQDWMKKINDPDYKNRLVHGLKIGDQMPDLPFGTVINNYTGKNKFSELKGKLVILDFWDTWCSTCMANFPHMEALQKEFGDKIQILLVNPIETAEQVNDYFRKNNKKYPNLPSIVVDQSQIAKKMWDLFPSREIGHQVWIDPNGTIKLRGFPLNNTSENIKAVLDGKPIFILKDKSTVPALDADYPYHKLLGDFVNTPVAYGSFFTRFNNEYVAAGGGGGSSKIENLNDSNTNTRRNTYMNVEIFQFYRSLFGELLRKQQAKILYGPGPKSAAGDCSSYILPKDTLRYTKSLLDVKFANAQEYMQRRFCYEQVVSGDLSSEKQKQYMLEDLNRYFGNLYGTEVKLEKRTVPCYILVRTSNKDKLASKAKNPSTKEILSKTETFIKREKVALSIFGDIFGTSPALVSLFLQNNKSNAASLLLNETGFGTDKYIDLTLPDSKSLTTIEDLRKALLPYDLDIQVANREIQFVVITDNSGK